MIFMGNTDTCSTYFSLAPDLRTCLASSTSSSEEKQVCVTKLKYDKLLHLFMQIQKYTVALQGY